jgi:hypothetical protein
VPAAADKKLEDQNPGRMGEQRPFAWVDDEMTDADLDWVLAHHPGRALLHHVPLPQASPTMTS